MTAEQKGQPREDGQSSKYEGEAWVKIVSASVGSAITALAVTPLDVVKVRQQAAGLSPGNAAAPVSAAPAPKTPAGTTSRSPSRSGASCARGCGTFVLNTGLGEYLTSRNRAGYFDPKTGALKQEKSVAEVLKTGGPFRIIRSIFAHEGLAGIYAGLAPTLVMGIPNTVLYFYTYEELALRFKERFPTNSPVSGAVPAISGASARFVASLSTAPLELLRTRQAARAGLDVSGTVSGREGRGMISEFRTMIQQDGVLSLFRGVRPTLMRDVPFSAIYWVCVENMRNFWRTRHRDLSTSAVSTTEQTIEALINGSVSGVIAAAFTTPLDVLKTRSQIETPAAVSVGKTAAVENVCVAPRLFCHHGGALAVHPESARLVSPAGSTPGTGTTQRLSTMNIAKSIVQAEGMGGLWRGNVAGKISFKIGMSTSFIILQLAALCYMMLPSQIGPMPVILWYWNPYFFVNAWLVLYTWLQHNDPSVPHYGTGEWTWVRGALSTIDRPYGIFDFFHHRIGSTHVAHHLFHEMPHYNALEATHALKAYLEPMGLYNYDPTPWYKAMWRVGKTCHYVQDDTGIQYYKSMEDVPLTKDAKKTK